MTTALPAGGRQPRPALLVSIHDISPLTLEPSRRAVVLAEEAGVGVDALTLLVIPCHEGVAPLDEHQATVDWLRRLSAAGATLVQHGYTHRMPGQQLGPRGLFWAHLFARGQGEFFDLPGDEAARRIEAGRAILGRAGLPARAMGFVPPAWLASKEAAAVIEGAGFPFHERLDGLHHRGQRRAERVVGFGSLNALEAAATATWASLQVRRRPTDTRFAIHPADLERPASTGAVRRTLRRLLEAHRPLSYAAYLGIA
jgi:predicted deacetylase